MAQRHDARRRGADGFPELSGRTVLVTGGAGFVGSHLVDALVDENEVRVLDDLSSGRPERVPAGVELIEGDVRDADALGWAVSDADIVFHQAGLVSVDRSVTAPVESHETNVAATVKLLDLAREEGARVVLASSCAIYGEPDSVPVAETDAKTPTSPYAADKLAIDHYARIYDDCYDVDVVPLRYFNVYGPRQAGGDYSGVVKAFLDQARAGEPITVHGDGEQTRDFVHVSDVVRANLAAATVDETGRAFNVGTGRSTSVRELAETVRSAVGSNSEIVHTEPRAADVRHSCADVTRARDGLGFEATVSLENGLATLTE
ncbi:UDP-glucose 4-epimerase [Natronoarchaeum philippinense]|uniref:UDP-glucose 4-epimerase n=1 Tax=Natronoarchaeum philippinense TaxID=558529 RepID=A0A285P6T5_NATPI|nr:NAD-dependent epimerase/dehydratase family protein [Natronoarchaeum philippinense]SNZ16987.1 UDP-glucose 4-epimerase [Natronoarchaeum philippinense]